jgi:hypothetical protein
MKRIINMITEDELVGMAFEILGGLLVTSKNPKEEAVKIMIEKTGLTDSIIEEVVSIAFENWMDI